MKPHMLYMDDQIMCELIALKEQLLGVVLQNNIGKNYLNFVSDIKELHFHYNNLDLCRQIS